MDRISPTVDYHNISVPHLVIKDWYKLTLEGSYHWILISTYRSIYYNKDKV